MSSPRAIIGNVISLAGSVAVAWGISHLLLIGSCGGEGAPPCPPETTPYAIAVTAGLVAAIVGGLLGRRMLTFALFPAIGLGAIWAAADSAGDARATALTIGTIFLAVSLVPVLLLLRMRQRARLAMRLLTDGRPAIGTITDIQDTGVTVNKNPRVTMTLRIEPEDRSAPFDGEKTTIISRVELPQRGHRYPVWYDPDDHSKFVVITKATEEAPYEVRRMFDRIRATAAAGEPAAALDGAGAQPADHLDRLAKLNELRLAGALTEDEFAAEKAKILDPSP